VTCSKNHLHSDFHYSSSQSPIKRLFNGPNTVFSLNTPSFEFLFYKIYKISSFESMSPSSTCKNVKIIRQDAVIGVQTPVSQLVCNSYLSFCRSIKKNLLASFLICVSEIQVTKVFFLAQL